MSLDFIGQPVEIGAVVHWQTGIPPVRLSASGHPGRPLSERAPRIGKFQNHVDNRLLQCVPRRKGTGRPRPGETHLCTPSQTRPALVVDRKQLTAIAVRIPVLRPDRDWKRVG